ERLDVTDDLRSPRCGDDVEEAHPRREMGEAAFGPTGAVPMDDVRLLLVSRRVGRRPYGPDVIRRRTADPGQNDVPGSGDRDVLPFRSVPVERERVIERSLRVRAHGPDVIRTDHIDG